MSDLDKMMEKLKEKKTGKKKENPQEETPKAEQTPIEEDDEDEEIPKADPEKVNVEGEVAILQNDGVYRREFLGALREMINVQKINAQALIELNKKIEEALNGKKK